MRVQQTTTSESRQPLPSKWVRRFVTVGLMWHIAALVAGPFTFATNRSSPIAVGLYSVARPYIQMLYLDHGYFFFAPNPGASHIVQYTVRDADDAVSAKSTFPDRGKHWPRLLYHRHFMLSETLNALYAPPDPPQEAAGDPELRQRWRRSREVYLTLWNSLRDHLRAEHGGNHVELRRLEHRPPTPYEFSDQQMPLTDPRLFREYGRDDPPEALP